MKNFLLISCCFLFFQFTSKSQFLLQEVTSMPMAVSNNAVVEGWTNGIGYAYSFGGIDSTKIWSGITKKSFRYNTVTDIWDTIPGLPNANAVIASGASYVDSIIYIMGGYQVLSNGNEISSNIVNRYDPRTNTYLSDGANIPLAIDDHVQAVYNDSLIYLITGWSNTGNFPNVQIYDPANDNWLTGTPVPNNNSYKAFGASGTIDGNTIYYHGGASTAFNFPAQNTMRIGIINPADPTQITWTNNIPDATVKTYRSISFISPSGDLYWMGGSEVTYNFNGIAYNGSGGVEPLNKTMLYFSPPGFQIFDQSIIQPDIIPMDLRGVAIVPSPLDIWSFGIIAGGMTSTQTVSDKTFILIEIPVNIEEKNKLKLFHLYPNPSKEQINLVFKKVEKRTISLIDILGKEMFNLKNSKISLQLDVADYPKGIYFIKVETDKGSSSQKIIIQ